MAKLVAQHDRLSVSLLAERYDVAAETVRRDLSALERMGLVRRVHGGVLPATLPTLNESRLVERTCAHTEARERIARAAVALLPPPGSTVLMDAGWTTLRLASMLPLDHPLVVFTHAVPVAAQLAWLPQVELHLLPGHVSATTMAAVGPDTLAALDRLRVDVAFLGTDTLGRRHGSPTLNPDDAATRHAVVRSARQVMVLCEGGRLGEETLAQLTDIDVLVTGASPDEDERSALGAAGVELVVA